MLWPKKNAYKEFDGEKNSCGSKTFSSDQTVSSLMVTVVLLFVL